MTKVKWWLRVVGVFYILQFVMNSLVHAPISAVGPEGALARASEGDPMARFLVDTWITFGLEVGAIGAVLVVASRIPQEAKLLVWTIIGIELTRGIVNDMYMIVRGYSLSAYSIWIVIHTVVIVTGLLSLRGLDSSKRAGLPSA